MRPLLQNLNLPTVFNGLIDLAEVVATGGSPSQNRGAIQAAIDQAATLGVGVLVPPGSIRFDAQITNPSSVPIVCVGELVFTGSGQHAIVYGSASAISQYAQSTTSVLRVRRETRDFSDAFAGVALLNVFEGRFLVRLENFETGLRLEGNNAGCVHNEIEIQRIGNCRVAVHLAGVGSGWANENTFFAGRITNDQATNVPQNVHGFVLEDATTVGAPNGNKFLGQSIELRNLGAGYTSAFHGIGVGPIAYNIAEGIRWETTTYLLSGAGLTNNVFGVAYRLTEPALAANILNPATPADELTLIRNRFPSANSIDSSEPLSSIAMSVSNVVEVGTNVVKPARGAVWSRTTNNMILATPGSRTGAAMTLSSANAPMGFLFDLRTVSRDFERTVFYKARPLATGGRLVAVCWDAAFALLTAAEECSLTFNGAVNYYRTGVDMTVDNSELQVAFGANVAFAFVGFAAGSAPVQMREFVASVYPTSDVQVVKDTAIYDALSAAPSGVGFVDSGLPVAATAPDVPGAATDYAEGQVCMDVTGATAGWAWDGAAWNAL